MVKYNKKDYVYIIENILKKKGNKYLAKWFDYPAGISL